MTPGTAPHEAALAQTVSKASALMEASPYIRRFRGSTVVIKYGGAAMVDEALKEPVARDIVMMQNLGINPIVIHGGGPEITALMERMGLEARFRNGQRVTDDAALEVAEMVLAGKLNGEIVSRINQAGGRAVGLSGKDGGLILARKLEDESGDMGFVGDVRAVDPRILSHLKDGGFIPVISPIGVDEEGQTYNINADTVAAAIAPAVGARKLVLLTDQRGILRNPKDESTLIASIRAAEIPDLIASKIISGGMIPKVRACMRALAGGVRKTHILDGRLPHSLLLELFTDEGIGTEIQ